ncbi:MAG: hydroxyacid dehydrogenase [Candidatus Odinarchaeia archaeon]
MKVLINDPIDQDGVKILKNKGLIVDIGNFSNAELTKKIGEYDVLIVRSRTIVNKNVIDAGKKLKIIARAGVGLDNIDVKYAKEKGIEIINAPAAPSSSVAELTMGLMLSLARRIPYGSQKLKEGEWVKKQLVGIELKDKTLGIIGYGRIGRAVALRAKAFEMNILVFDVFEKVIEQAYDDGFKVFCPAKDDLKEMLKKCDFITLHIPLIPATKNFLDVEEFKVMKEGVFIINTSRGGIINEEVLLENLNSGKVAGAGLDVFETEPPLSGISRKIVEHPNTITTPHIGANTHEAQKRAALIIAVKIIKKLFPDVRE